MVEFALVFPLLLLLVVGGTDLARAYFVGVEVSDAARESALYIARTGPYGSPASYAAQIPPSGSCTGSACSTYPAIFVGEQAFAGSLLTCPSAATTWTVAPPLLPNTPSPSSGYGSDSFEVSVTVTCALRLLTPLLPSPVAIEAKSTAYVVEP